jgi:hypothetical protein
MASLAPFLDGAGGRLARSTPEVDDEASATDLQRNEIKKQNTSNQEGEIKSREKEDVERKKMLGLGLGFTCATGSWCRRRRRPPQRRQHTVSKNGEQRRRDDRNTNSHITKWGRERGERKEIREGETGRWQKADQGHWTRGG